MGSFVWDGFDWVYFYLVEKDHIFLHHVTVCNQLCMKYDKGGLFNVKNVGECRQYSYMIL